MDLAVLVSVLSQIDFHRLDVGWRSPASTWGVLCGRIGLINNDVNRKKLYSMWKNNTYNIVNLVVDKKKHVIDDDNKEQEKNTTRNSNTKEIINWEYNKELVGTDAKVSDRITEVSSTGMVTQTEGHNKDVTEAFLEDQLDEGSDKGGESENEELYLDKYEINEITKTNSNEIRKYEINETNHNRSELYRKIRKTVPDNETGDGTNETYANVNKENEEDMMELDNLNEEDMIELDNLEQESIEKYKFKLTLLEWKTLEPKRKTHLYGRRLNSNWTTVFANKVKTIGINCPLVFQYNRVKMIGSRKKRSSYFRGKARCKFPDCATIEFEMKKQPSSQRIPSVRVNVKGRSHHKGKRKKRNTTGVEKESILHESIKHGPSETFHKRISEIPENQFYAKNMDGCPRPAAIRKIQSRNNLSDRIDMNQLLECLFLKKIYDTADIESSKIKGYIQYLSMDPFTVISYTERQLKSAKKHLKNKGVLYFDATGSVVRKIEDQKRILYYSIIYETAPGEPPLPIGELLTTDHTTINIRHFLERLQKDLFTVNGKRCCIQRIEVDYSWALIYGSTMAINILSLPDYLEKAWNICNQASDQEEITCVIHICAAHFVHNFANKLSGEVKDKELRQLFLHCLGKLLNTTTLADAQRLYKKILLVFDSEYVTEDVDLAAKELNDELRWEGPSNEFHEPIIEPTFDEKAPKKSLRENSKFYQHFAKLRKKSKKQQASGVLNKYYSPFSIDSLEKQMHIFPQWSGLLLGGCTRETNSLVEDWMGIVKNSILQRKRKLRPADFLMKMQATLKGRLRRLELIEMENEEIHGSQRSTVDRQTKSTEARRRITKYGDKENTNDCKHGDKHSSKTKPIEARKTYDKDDKGNKDKKKIKVLNRKNIRRDSERGVSLCSNDIEYTMMKTGKEVNNAFDIIDRLPESNNTNEQDDLGDQIVLNTNVSADDGRKMKEKNNDVKFVRITEVFAKTDAIYLTNISSDIDTTDVSSTESLPEIEDPPKQDDSEDKLVLPHLHASQIKRRRKTIDSDTLAISPLHFEETWSKTQKQTKSKYFSSPVRKQLMFDASQNVSDGVSFAFRSFKFPPWGGRLKTATGFITLTNTCPIDNMLSIMNVITSTRGDIHNLLRSSEHEAVKVLMEVMKDFKTGNWACGKVTWLEKICGFHRNEPKWDVWGSEDLYVLSKLDILQEITWISTCSQKNCPLRIKVRKGRTICPSPTENETIQRSIFEWEQMSMRDVLCDISVDHKTTHTTYRGVFDKKGRRVGENLAYLCDGIRRSSNMKFTQSPPVIFIKADNARALLKRDGIEERLMVMGKIFLSVGVTSLVGGHVTACIRDVYGKGGWYRYDGINHRRIVKVRTPDVENADYLVYMSK